MVVARSPEGEFAILRGHIPFLAALVPGLVKIKSGSSEDRFLVTGGVLEASGTRDDYHVIVLADDAEDAGDLSREEALRQMTEMKRESDTEDRGEAEMRVAMAAPELRRG